MLTMVSSLPRQNALEIVHPETFPTKHNGTFQQLLRKSSQLSTPALPMRQAGTHGQVGTFEPF